MRLIDLFTSAKKPATRSATSTTASSMVEALEGRTMMSVAAPADGGVPSEPSDPVSGDLVLDKKAKVVSQGLVIVKYYDKASPVLM